MDTGSDAKVDDLLFLVLRNKEAAVYHGEAVNFGARQVVAMESPDLQMLILPQNDRTFHLFIVDPIQDGSGFLGQLLEKWHEVFQAALAKTEDCPSGREQSCSTCLGNYRSS